MAGIKEAPKFGRRALLATASAVAVESMLPNIARPEGIQQYFVGEPNERGERPVQISLNRGQIAMIGGELFTTGGFKGANVEIGGACVPYIGAFAANTDVTFGGIITGDPHIEIFDFGSDVPFENLPTEINRVLRFGVGQINREQKDVSHVGVPAVQVAGFVIGINRGRQQTDPGGRENRPRFVDEEFEVAPAPAACPAAIRARVEALPTAAPVPTAVPAPTAKIESTGITWGSEDHFNALDAEVPFGDASSWMLVTGWDNKDAGKSTFQLRIAPGVVVRVKGVVGTDWHVWGGADTARWDQMNTEIQKRDGVNPTVYTVNSVADAQAVAGKGWQVQVFPK